jgi:hypothetical protein
MVRFTATAVASVLVWVFAASSGGAFSPSSSFLGGQRHVRQQSNNGSPRSIQNGGALQMNLFDRFSRVAKSNLNNILKNLEDPEKIMTQALEDMQVRFLLYLLCFGAPCQRPR